MQEAYGILDVDREVDVFREAVDNLNGWILNQNISDPFSRSQTYSSLVTSDEETDSGTAENQDSKKINLDIKLAKDPIKAGSTEKITVKVTEDDNSDGIGGASIEGVITHDNDIIKPFSGISDAGGAMSYSWKISENSRPGTYEVNVDASVPGFGASSESKSFEVQAKASQTSSSSETDSSSETEYSPGYQSRCPDGYHRSPSGDCEKVTNTKGMPRCQDGYHRSPSGDCERVR